jgi:hypothetical protein
MTTQAPGKIQPVRDKSCFPKNEGGYFRPLRKDNRGHYERPEFKRKPRLTVGQPWLLRLV